MKDFVRFYKNFIRNKLAFKRHDQGLEQFWALCVFCKFSGLTNFTARWAGGALHGL